ncbi:helix-turn-helix domain-containing protein [Nocardia salmonicida]|uniref:helix-turn-helix domain-containing protein n=1 Tax=Nocardia salmonicida TaxID=53431 RepID=UPI0033E7279D
MRAFKECVTDISPQPGVHATYLTLPEQAQRTASAQRQPVPAIARLMQVSEAHVRQVIHDFNEQGFEALDPKWSAGRPKKVDRATRERIACIARCCPRDLGWPFLVWSLSKLRRVLATNKIAEISRETLRTILKAEGVSWQAVKTWKADTDPEFATKMHRILDLYDHRPADGRVVCVDEFGPLNRNLVLVAVGFRNASRSGCGRPTTASKCSAPARCAGSGDGEDPLPDP